MWDNAILKFDPGFKAILHDVRKNYRELFKSCIVIQYELIAAQITHMRDEKVRAEVLHQMVVEVVGKNPTTSPTRDKIIEKRVEEARHRRKKQGDL